MIMESAQGPNPSFFFFIRLGACWDTGLDLDLDQGLTIYPVCSGPVVTMARLHAGARNASNKSFYITPSPVTPQAQAVTQGEQRQIGVNTKEINVKENTTSLGV